MNKKYEPLFTPWKIGNVEIKNRIVQTSMGGTSIFGFLEPNHFDEEAAKFLLERARNNAGLILPGIAFVLNPVGGEWLYENKEMYKKLKDYLVEFHKTGCKIFIQLTAGFGRCFPLSTVNEQMYLKQAVGLMDTKGMDIERQCASASTNPNRWSDKVPSRPYTIDEIHEMVSAFAKTAKCCKDAGVDGVEIHAVHEGYTIDQFTLKYTNRRKDEYGGSFENRYRFPVEILHAIKDLCGNDFPVSIRYSIESKTKGFREGALPGEKFTEVGRDKEEGIKAAQYFEKQGCDMLNCDNGTYDAWYWNHPPIYMPHDCNLPEALYLKKYVHIPLVVAGRMDPVVAAQAIEKGQIDAMGVARQFLADPAWVTKLMNGREDEIRPCICCHTGCFPIAHYKGMPNDESEDDTLHMSRCAVNPETMQTDVHYIKKTDSPKRVDIVGGGLAGMECARVLALRGHKPTIYEKTGSLGGVFVWAAEPSFKDKDRELLAWYRLQMKDLGVEVKLNTEVKDIHKLPGDVTVIGTGAVARKFKIPGFDKSMEACDYLSGAKKTGETVVIVGGGLTGCEIAYDLCLKGKKPIIVEMLDDLMVGPGICAANSSYLKDYFKLHNVEVHLNSAIKEIKDGEAICVHPFGKEFSIKCDSVVMSVGYTPAPLAPASQNVYQIGDCAKVGNARNAIWAGYETAMKI